MRYLIVLGALLVLAGCGGSGGSSIPTFDFPAVNTSRVGTWQGRATDSVSSDAGVLSLTIDDKGVVRGTWRTDDGVSWTIAGNFELPPFEDVTTLAFTAPGQKTLSEHGTLAVGISGRFGGILRATEIGPANRPVEVSRIALDLTRQ